VTGLLILDFDGTLCLGDEPVRAYARAVAYEARFDPAVLLAPLDAFLGGEPATPGILEGTSDGYQAVAALGSQHALDSAALGRAYRASRLDVDAGRVPLHAAPGMADELERWAGWRRVLVTNAPEEGTRALIGSLGYAHVVDTVIGDAGKPAGLERLLESGGALDVNPALPLASIGDIWRNDLAPVAQLGGLTALIERHPQVQATPTVRAREPHAALRMLRDSIQDAGTAS